MNSYTEAQRKEIEKIIRKFKESMKKDKGLEELGKEISKKRLSWFEENKSKLRLTGTDVEKALQLLLLKIRINPEDIKIVEKSSNRIVYESFNFCPVLEACKIIGLDTREVCKRVYEKSTQIFIRKINPKLRFKRNYEKIRPYAKYCEETIEMKR